MTKNTKIPKSQKKWITSVFQNSSKIKVNFKKEKANKWNKKDQTVNLNFHFNQ